MVTEKDFSKTDYAWNIYFHNQELIKLADTKVRYLFLISSLATTYILTEANKIQNIEILEYLFLIAFFLFLIFASLTLKPRSSKYSGDKVPTLIYHRDISSRTTRFIYTKDFKNTSKDELLDDLLYQIFEISLIADRKYQNYNYAFYSLIGQIVLFFILIV